MKSYVEQFLSLSCSGDILNLVNPINNLTKEISEAMAMIKRLRPLVLTKEISPFTDEIKRFTVIDCCTGNGLTGVTATFLFSNVRVISVDKNRPKRNWDIIRRYNYIRQEIPPGFDLQRDVASHFIPPLDILKDDIIVMATHACGESATDIVNFYKKHDECKHLILMPCCQSKIRHFIPYEVKKRLGNYLSYCYDLALDVDGDIRADKRCLSPCNAIITASK